jgi:SAM-dependent methyltransferase
MTFRFIRRWFGAFVDPRRVLSAPQIVRYACSYRAFKRLGGKARLRDTYPCLADRTRYTQFDPHYFYQAAWIARRLAEARPAHHVDVASHNMILAVVSGFVPCTFIDFRPLPVNLPNLDSQGGSILGLPLADRSVSSLSCLHVIEHIGLGRYGDPLDVAGDVKAARELARVLAPGGRLYLVTPIGRPRIEFNAHRVFAPEAVAAMMPELRLVSFSAVDDQYRFHERVQPADFRQADYACGMYEFERPI